MEYVQDLPNQKSRLVRRTPLKARTIHPPKPIRKRKVPILTHFTELFSNETTPNEHSEVKDVHETSNSPSFDCQDTDSRPIGQNTIKDKDSNLDTTDSDIETMNWESKDAYETSDRPSFDCQDNDLTSTGQTMIQNKDSTLDTTDSEIETLNWESNDVQETSNIPSFDCQDTDPRFTGEDPIEDKGPNPDTKASGIEGLEAQKDVYGNSESTVEPEFSSGGDALVDIVDAPSEKNIQLDISGTFVLDFLFILAEERKSKKEESVSLVQARDILKQELGHNIAALLAPRLAKYYFETASVQLFMATSDECAKLKEEKEQLLQEMLEIIQKLSGIVKKYREISGRFSGDYEDEHIKEEWNAEDYERKHQEECDDNRYSFPTFLANFLLFAAIILIFILPAIVFQGFDDSNANGYIHAFVSWFNLHLESSCIWQTVREWFRSSGGLVLN
ncbi:hypothetical protein JTE90_017090 [Oedothorax gibbosus]|uniref:Uncharacterized protein n=1 Tax=Oedothorax gibbosus TaxID=931172 RepID=A0AAV6UFS8_9ARAC|nr:hypothetical protein JTE90_017090 [Oedothorax gibbosus]